MRMAKAVEPIPTSRGEITFQLDRFETKSDDRVEVSGRWFGVRGRRFIRPTLTVVADGHGCRALADLEHKPWAAEDGQPWEAAFVCALDGAELLEAELNVSPDITIMLPVDGPGTAKGPRRGRTAREPRQRRDPAERSAPAARAPAPRSSRPPEDVVARREIGGLRSTLEEVRSEADRLRGELERSEAERTAAATRLEQLTAELEQAVAARDAAVAARDKAATERKSAIAARDQARAAHERSAVERDRAASACEEAIAARDAALESRDAAVALREDALDVRDQTEAERIALLRARDSALAERDAALNAKQQAVADREILAARADVVRNRHEDELASRGAAMVMRNATIASGAFRHHAGWPRRALAILVVLAVAIALLIVLRVL
jgi:hypothetical protein